MTTDTSHSRFKRLCHLRDINKFNDRGVRFGNCSYTCRSRTFTRLGLFPTVASKFGGRPVNQIIGATIGTLIFAAVFAAFSSNGFPTGMDLVLSIISGAGWGFGQIITFKSFEYIGSSRAMPITTAFQLLGASLWGVIALGDWPGVSHKIIGFIALFVILIGAWMTVWSENGQAANSKISVRQSFYY